MFNCAVQNKEFFFCIQYTKNCNFQWKELEEQIIKNLNVDDMTDYADYVLKQRWVEVEPLILKAADSSFRNRISAVYYAEKHIKSQWPELEQIILKHKDVRSAFLYAFKIMKTRWKEMEPYILNTDRNKNSIFNVDSITEDAIRSYKSHFKITESCRLGWYKRSQSSYNFENYLNIGHPGFDKGEYGCNYLWFFYKNGTFKHTKETESINNHANWQYEHELSGDYIYKGRVDACKKTASLTSCGGCLNYTKNTINIAKEMFCERLKDVCKNQIYRVFGNDIIIKEFL